MFGSLFGSSLVKIVLQSEDSLNDLPILVRSVCTDIPHEESAIAIAVILLTPLACHPELR